MTTATWTVYAYLNLAWYNLTPYVQPSLTAEWGISGNGPLDRVADVGELKFDLNNASGIFSPENAAALSGWKLGVPVKLTFTFESEEYIRFYGFVSDIQIDPGAYGSRRAHVTVLDWLDYATKHPIVNPGIQST